MFNNSEYPSRENILHKIPQIEIFRRYLNIWVDENSYFRNPLRKDESPTCQFRWSGDRLRMIDYRPGEFRGDCFDLVSYMNGDCSYKKALEIVWRDLRLGTVTKSTALKTELQALKKKKRSYKTFWVKSRKWHKKDLEFWGQFGITLQILELFQVKPIEILWIGDDTFKQNEAYRYNPDDPAYAYYFGKHRWKVYFPKRKSQRFLSNTDCIQGLNQLDTSKYLVITKSLKDVMVLYTYNIPAIAPQSESVVLKELDNILYAYNIVFILFDNDIPGRKGTIEYRDRGCIPLLLPRSTGAKDVAELRAINKDLLDKLVDETKTMFI